MKELVSLGWLPWEFWDHFGKSEAKKEGSGIE